MLPFANALKKCATKNSEVHYDIALQPMCQYSTAAPVGVTTDGVSLQPWTARWSMETTKNILQIRWGVEGRGSKEVKIDLMHPGVPKVSNFSFIFDLPGGFLWKA
jgi:hypothetical protein